MKRKYPKITIVTNRTIEGVNYRKDINVVRYIEAQHLLEMLIEGFNKNNVEKIGDAYITKYTSINSRGQKVHSHVLYIVE